MGSGGGRGSGYIPPSSEKLRQLVAEAEAKEREHLDGDVNTYLADVLATVNERDVDTIRQHLSQIEGVIEGDTEIEQLLLGGSVA